MGGTPEGAFNATLFIDALQANGPFSAGWPSRRRSPAAPVARGPRTGGGRFWGTRSACAANQDLATLVTNARFFVAKDSGHDVHQDQPELVIEAIRQGVAGVRNPDTCMIWHLAVRTKQGPISGSAEPPEVRVTRFSYSWSRSPR